MALQSPANEDGASRTPPMPSLPFPQYQLLTPPPAESVSVSVSGPGSVASRRLPNNCQYYSEFLSKDSFNSLLTRCAANLVRILYRKHDIPHLDLFIVEILRRSKTSILLLQLTCYYLARLISLKAPVAIKDEKKLFVGLLIVASKFNQDYNFSFRAWLRICGTSNDGASIQGLRAVERECLKLLDHAIYLNGARYEHWCNALAIFGYDFVARHSVNGSNSLLVYDGVCPHRLQKWRHFFELFLLHSSSPPLTSFDQYFRLQLGTKVLIAGDAPCRKRPWPHHAAAKKVRVS